MTIAAGEFIFTAARVSPCNSRHFVQVGVEWVQFIDLCYPARGQEGGQISKESGTGVIKLDGEAYFGILS